MAATGPPGSQRAGLRRFTTFELSEATAGFHPHCLIGSGGFGNVYRAMVGLTPVAIKVLDHGGLQGLKEMENEMTLLAGLYHPHLVCLLGYTSEQGNTANCSSSSSTFHGQGEKSSGTGCHALVYELQTKGNLEECLARKGGLPPLLWPARVRIAAQVCSALAFLHSRSIIHRDIKPANVFLDAHWNAKLGDIGLAAMDNLYNSPVRNQGDTSDTSGEAIGTWQYLAPEYRAEAGARSSLKTDTYALGLTLLQLLSGGSSTRNLVQVAQKALEGDTLATQFLDPTAGQWDLRIAERVVKLALWCSMHQPSARPLVAVIHKELERLVDQLPVDE